MSRCTSHREGTFFTCSSTRYFTGRFCSLSEGWQRCRLKHRVASVSVFVLHLHRVPFSRHTLVGNKGHDEPLQSGRNCRHCQTVTSLSKQRQLLAQTDTMQGNDLAQERNVFWFFRKQNLKLNLKETRKNRQADRRLVTTQANFPVSG